ncbi:MULTISPECIES: adenylate/guanylate cyclase domain-containing protein [Microcystis]|uniref:Adenylate/guanylate cyclase domain-containing protein n=2 Tax=Microcystis TaxID=1125 RepID=A0A841UQ20_MICAE|nr:MULTISPECIES: adenylate/guanylate cyclase domain-containing protein [Microcystis]AKV67678.1 Adenylate cyclase [Microcystis panniformis FACHB-1757]MBC1191094.1 adenylate/guanylate cyclase domain-containing protein [Microcystis aeruginosa BLCC-F108]MCA2589716.1 adenylate/guanylate cyclase domain-containing protein [Microcystis sp. M31BS1]MDB9408318.1 adenylate/guanylate cyclase domain-containing protein [Microcystis aeruginosa CS-558/01A06]TRT75098.1 MAG: adenylate/guanylate cyclase domain-co
MDILGQNPYLLLHTEKGQRFFPLVGRPYWTIGRSKDNAIVIKDQCISRNHAILQSTETGDFYLIDLGSRNGTFVNGRRVAIPVTIHDKDRIAFGKTEVQFYRPTPTNIGKQPHNLELDPPTSTVHERRLTSVIVVDIRNFTALTRQLDEKVLSSLIGNWFRHAGSIIRSSGSWVDKYIGDAIMAIWFHGQQEVNQDDILQIFQAITRIYKMTRALSEEYPLPFKLRIGAGVNTGYAMVGNTGSGEHPDYTAIGDTVNAAFRLESATKEIGRDLAIGATTYSHLIGLPHLHQAFEQHTLSLKGYDDKTITYGTTFDDLDRFLDVNISEEITGITGFIGSV